MKENVVKTKGMIVEVNTNARSKIESIIIKKYSDRKKYEYKFPTDEEAKKFCKFSGLSSKQIKNDRLLGLGLLNVDVIMFFADDELKSIMPITKGNKRKKKRAHMGETDSLVKTQE